MALAPCGRKDKRAGVPEGSTIRMVFSAGGAVWGTHAVAKHTHTRTHIKCLVMPRKRRTFRLAAQGCVSDAHCAYYAVARGADGFTGRPALAVGKVGANRARRVNRDTSSGYALAKPLNGMCAGQPDAAQCTRARGGRGAARRLLGAPCTSDAAPIARAWHLACPPPGPYAALTRANVLCMQRPTTLRLRQGGASCDACMLLLERRSS